MKQLLLGNEAIALGAIDAGLSGVYAYPGTPSTEITEFIQQHPLQKERNIHCRWSSNEKTAMEAALGMSYSGKRALVCMKMVGMNVCADPFVNSAITGVNGGLCVLVADDPSMHSSQNEQDTRFYGKFAMIPIFEPGNQQECYDLMPFAFDMSERLKVPVLIRIVTRLSHSRAAVEVKSEARPCNDLLPDEWIRTGAPSHWVLLPAVARRNYVSLIEKQKDMEESSEDSGHNRLLSTSSSPSGRGDASPLDSNHKVQTSNFKFQTSNFKLQTSNFKVQSTGIIAAGIGYNYVMEAHPEGVSAILKITQYPLPEKMIKKLADISDRILVVEDGQPFIEEAVKGILGAGYPVIGRLTGDLPRTGELNPDTVGKALGRDIEITFKEPEEVVGRPPQLCQGCGHRDVYGAIDEIIKEYPNARIFGDIGCYSLGALKPFSALSTNVCMGASITMAKGAADAGLRPAIAVIGDSTFTHSGMTGLLDAANENTPITVVISDNLTTAMTGGQPSAGTNKFEQICIALGVAPEHVRVITPTPKNMPAIVQMLREEIAYEGVSVIIPFSST